MGITVAGGALGISITFVEKIAPHPSQATLFILGLSWLAYIGAILAGFSAIYWSRKAIYKALEISRQSYDRFVTTSTGENPAGDPASPAENSDSNVVNCLNKGSLSCLVAGTVFLCVFAMINLTNAKNSTAPAQPTAALTNQTIAANTNTNKGMNTNKGQP